MLIGCGRWGSKLAVRFSRRLRKDNLLLCDTKFLLQPPKRARWHTDYRQVLNDVDACVVATLPPSHYEIARTCLEAGKHVLVEKPMTLEPGQAYELCDLAERRGLTLMTDDTFMYRKELWEILCEGQLRPRVNYVRAVWVNPREETPPEGIWWTLGPHPISIMNGLMAGRFPLDMRGEIRERFVHLRFGFIGGDEAELIMDWDSVHRERYVSWGTVDSCYACNFKDTEQQPDALSVMCGWFLRRCQVPWIDWHGAHVVDLLRSVEKVFVS